LSEIENTPNNNHLRRDNLTTTKTTPVQPKYTGLFGPVSHSERLHPLKIRGHLQDVQEGGLFGGAYKPKYYDSIIRSNNIFQPKE
jgi:hypothetical protein